jgi:hypothetical protein
LHNLITLIVAESDDVVTHSPARRPISDALIFFRMSKKFLNFRAAVSEDQPHGPILRNLQACDWLIKM